MACLMVINTRSYLRLLKEQKMSPLVVTDFDIQALVDNELPWEHEKQVRAYIKATPDAQKRYDELCRQKRLLQEWWAKGGFSH